MNTRKHSRVGDRDLSSLIVLLMGPGGTPNPTVASKLSIDVEVSYAARKVEVRANGTGVGVRRQKHFEGFSDSMELIPGITNCSSLRLKSAS